jgi:hypothetical protein
VEIQSDKDLVNAVQAHCSPTAKLLTPVQALNRRRALKVRSGDILRELGKASSPPHLRRGAFNATSQWAWIRYRWAFEKDQYGGLAVTSEALRLRYHHSTVFSEQVGIAFGLDVARKILRRSHVGAMVTFHDVDFVMEGVALQQVHVTTGSKRPDYIARVEELGGKVVYYAIECKGRRNYNPRDMAVQLATGASQVQHLRVGGLGLPSLIIGTSAGPNGIYVYALDPEEEGPSHQALDRVRPTPKPRVRQTPRGEEIDPEQFVERMAAAASAEVLLNAGLHDEAGDLLDQDIEAGDSTTPLMLGGQPFRGELFTAPVNGRLMTFFRGVHDSAVVHSRSRIGTSLRVDDLLIPRPLDLDEDTEALDVPNEADEQSDSEGVTSVDDSGFAVGAWYGNN